EATRWADARGLPLRVLGGGSNIVVADDGVEALVVHVALRGVSSRDAGGAVAVTAAAGEPWDPLVGRAGVSGWAGPAGLRGIPGLVGATPMQNVGAYGQEVSQTVTAVRVLDRRSGAIATLSAADCGFGYRTSRFKSGEADRFIVLAVTYRLLPPAAPPRRYPDRAEARVPRARPRRPPPRVRAARRAMRHVRRSGVAIRGSKSMVLDPADDNRRSCGSFFLNPIVDASRLAEVERAAGDASVPRWAEAGGRTKLSAAWLIERAGFR